MSWVAVCWQDRIHHGVKLGKAHCEVVKVPSGVVQRCRYGSIYTRKWPKSGGSLGCFGCFECFGHLENEFPLYVFYFLWFWVKSKSKVPKSIYTRKMPKKAWSLGFFGCFGCFECFGNLGNEFPLYFFYFFVILSQKCPKRSTLEKWQKRPGHLVFLGVLFPFLQTFALLFSLLYVRTQNGRVPKTMIPIWRFGFDFIWRTIAIIYFPISAKPYLRSVFYGKSARTIFKLKNTKNGTKLQQQHRLSFTFAKPDFRRHALKKMVMWNITQV